MIRERERERDRAWTENFDLGITLKIFESKPVNKSVVFSDDVPLGPELKGQSFLGNVSLPTPSKFYQAGVNLEKIIKQTSMNQHFDLIHNLKPAMRCFSVSFQNIRFLAKFASKGLKVFKKN